MRSMLRETPGGPAARQAWIAAGIVALGAGSAARAWVEPAVNALHTFSGVAGELYGWAVATLEDIDGDGVREALIPAPFAAGGGRFEVRSGATGALIFSKQVAGTTIGYAIADAGDVNNDGLHDVIVGSTFGSGRAIIYSGAGPTYPILHNLIAVAGGQFGTAVSSAGDINGDNRDDVLVGAQNAGGTGQAYVISGATGAVLRTHIGPAAGSRFGAGASLIGDVNGDGVKDHAFGAPGSAQVFIHSGATGTHIRTLTGPPSAGAYGEFFVSELGDLDADGVGDIYVGDYADNPGGGVAPEGAAYVYSGATGAIIRSWHGTPAINGVGPGRGAGDINGDGREDVLVGAYTASFGAANAGRITVYSGLTGLALRTFSSTLANEQMGFDGLGIGDVNADGRIDFLCAGANLSNVYIIAGVRCPGDANGDGGVDTADLGLLIGAFGTGAANADFNGDGVVDTADLGILIANFGKQGC